MAIYYLDPELGIDSGGIATDKPLGWWSVAFTAGTGVAPTADAVCSNNAQSAKLTVCVISSGTFAGNNAAGTLYFYGKTGAFAAGSITWTGGGATIAADANYNPWKTISSTGATAARMAPGDTVRIKQSPPPTSLGVTGKWTSTVRAGGKFDATLAASATANNGSGLVRLTVSSTTTLANNDVVQVLGIAGTVEANGSWVCTVINSTQIDLQGSAYVNAKTGGNGTCQKITSKAVVLSSSLTQTLHNCDVNNWVGAGDGTPSLVAYTTDAKEGQGCIKITMDAATQANVLQSYAPISISAATAGNYNCISFWIKNSAAIATATTYTITLCSAANGTGVLDTFVVPAIPSVNQWVPLTIARTGGGTLGNNGATAIASIAVNSGATAPTNSSNIMLDNIIATKTGSINLQSLISLNSSLKDGTEGWYGIQSINKDGTVVLLDNSVNNICNTGSGYFSTTLTTTATTYIRETTKTAMVATAAIVVQECQESGSAGNLESYEGGYDTATNTQIGETFFDGLNGFGYGLQISSKTYNSINYLNFCRYSYGIVFTTATYIVIGTANNLNNNTNSGLYMATNSDYNTISKLGNVNNNASYGFAFSTCKNISITNVGNINNNSSYGFNINALNASNIGTISNICNNGGAGIAMGQNNYSNNFGTISNVSYNSNYGILLTLCNWNYFNTITNANYNSLDALSVGGSNYNTVVTLANANYNRIAVSFVNSTGNKVSNITATGNTSSAIGNDLGVNYIRNTSLSGTKFNTTVSYANSRIYSENHDQTPGLTYVYTDNGVITSELGATYGHTASGRCWKLSPTNVIRNSTYPLDMVVAKTAVSANKLVTVKAWMKLTSTTDILGALVCRSGQLSWSDGTADIQVNMSTANTNYNEVTLTCTPTEAGVLEFEAWAWWVAGAATQSVYIDDLTITQAA